MSTIKVEIRTGAYYDSAFLMQLQSFLVDQDKVLDVGVVMGTDPNKDILAQGGLLVPEAQAANPDDLMIVVKGETEQAAELALAKVDELIASRHSHGGGEDYLPKTVESAADLLPEAHWVLVSVAGRYAAGVARKALALNKHVFLYSDNVSVKDEISLKQEAANKGLLVMGPDCGTAIVNGFGLGFANKVRKGPIGMVAASGTGLQQVSVRIHQMGGGLTHAIGTGGRDIKDAVSAISVRQGLELMGRDPNTKVIVIVSKPPSKQVADELIKAARQVGKPVVIDFIGYAIASRQVDNIYFAATFDETAQLAVDLSIGETSFETLDISKFTPGQKYLRGLFSGGTLAYESLLILHNYFTGVYSNIPLAEEFRLKDSLVSQEHTLIDLGEDEFTVGRLHPMMDNDLRVRRIEKEVANPEVALIFLDIVLGYGAHKDPASELAPAIAAGIKKAKKAGRHLEFVVVVIGTDEDPQNMAAQVKALEKAGARVETSNDQAANYVGKLLKALVTDKEHSKEAQIPGVDLDTLAQPLAAINVGLESFAESLQAQGAQTIHVDWHPPAGGNEKMMAILERMKQK